ncbi:MAG: Crp/Fnr family transcriptional regulator, partial [Acidaminobacteraceae bacterium]
PVEYLHLLLNGKARVSPISEEGKIGLLDFIMAKDIIGDLEYFSNDLYYYNVTALLPCVVLAIPVKYIDEFFNQNVSFYKFICRNMSTKMKRTSLKYSKKLLYPVKNQVANYFYELYVKSDKLTLPIMFKETAEFFDISPRYFRSVLVELELEGVISRENSGIKIVDTDKLKNYEI